MAAVKKVDVKDHWRHELSKLRCWLEGYKAGRHIPGCMGVHIPGEMAITQIILAIDNAKVKNGKDQN